MDQAVAILHPVQDLTVIPSDIRLRVFTEPGAIEPWLDHVRKNVADFVPDLTTARGRANIKSIAFEVTKSKTYLTKVGKELADEQKAIPKLIDATRKHITDTLEALATEVRKPLTDWEIADEERVARHRNTIASFATLSQASWGGDALTIADLKQNLATVEAQPIGDNCEEFLSEYQRARDASVLILKTLIPIREAAEADRAELIQLRAAAAARDERDRFEADMLEKATAEKLMGQQAAARKVESDRLAAEAAAQLVRDTEARLAREAEEVAARRAEEILQRQNDEANVEAINNEIIRAFIGAGISEMDAVAVLGLIASGSVPYVTVQY
jgi:septal ring factor EnvC (AmiA/AmiB activator)